MGIGFTIARLKMTEKMESKPSSMAEEQLELFLDALRAIPNDEKGAYLSALDRCPQVLHRESCISRFLRYARGNDIPTTAARQFVDYWEKRKNIFGCSRAFTPMTLCNGALSESCKALISAGWIAPLPQDSNGKRVCFLDMTVEASRYQLSQEDRLCCLFYALQVISEDASAQTNGITLIVLYDDFCYTPKTAIEGLEETLRVMPVQVTELHIIPSGRLKEQSDFFEEFVPRALKTLLSPNESDHGAILDSRQHIYMNESPHQVLNKLLECGLHPDNLPAKIGGGWTTEHHNAWIKLRLVKEEEMTKDSSQSLEKIFFPGRTKTTGKTLTSSVRKKRREAKHSRQKRDRKRCRVKALNLHIQHLEDKRRQARATTETLERALAEATKLVSEVESNFQGKSIRTLATQQIPGGLRTIHPALSLPRAHGLPFDNRSSGSQHFDLHPSVAVSANGPVSVVVVPAGDIPPYALSNLPSAGLGQFASTLNYSNLALQSPQVSWVPTAQSAAAVYRNLAIDRLLQLGVGLPRQTVLPSSAGGPYPSYPSQGTDQGFSLSSLNHLYFSGPK